MGMKLPVLYCLYIYIYIDMNKREAFINKHFESSQKLRKDGIGILENFIENTLSNFILTLYLFTVVL